MRLVTPDQIEQACIELLGGTFDADGNRVTWGRLVEHLAALERELGLQPQTIERPATVDLLADDERHLARDELPAILLSVEELNEPPTRELDGRRETLKLTWRMEIEVLDQGASRADAKQRVRWLAMTVVECLYQRLQRRAQPLESLDLDSLRFEIHGKSPALGRATINFVLVVPDSITLRGGLPVDADETPPAGEPGGPPATPYDEPAPWPAGPHDLVVDVGRAPLSPPDPN